MDRVLSPEIYFKKLLKKNYVFKSFIKQAKKNKCAKIIMTSIEKWNYPNKQNNDKNYDVCGKSWEDICVQYNYKLYNPKDIIRYFVKLFKYKDFSLREQKYLFTLTSFEVMKYDLAEEKASKIVNLDSIEIRFEKISKSNLSVMSKNTKKEKETLKKYRNEIKSQYTNISDKELINSMSKDYFRISNYKTGIYVLKDNPTIIVVDNNKGYSFDLKDGWSNKRIAEIIQNYLSLLGYSYNVVIKGE